MGEAPAPPIAADADLSDFKFIPLHIDRLKRSKAWLLAKRRPELGFYLVNLWTAAWQQVPAGSLEDDDDELCDKAMCDPKNWPKVREAVLRGWVKCSDGRLYHPVVAEIASESWESRVGYRARTAAARAARKAKRDTGAGNVTSTVAASVTENATEPVTNSVTQSVAASVTVLKGEREGQGESPKAPDAQTFPKPDARPLVCRGYSDGDLRDVIRETIEAAGFSAANLPMYTRQIWAWYADGCHPEEDCLETVKSLMRQRNGPPNTLQFFDKAIWRARDDRLKREADRPERVHA